MKFQPLKRNRLTRSPRFYLTYWLILAALVILMVGCSSEEEPARQDEVQTSNQKKDGAPEVVYQTEEVTQHIKAAVDQIVSSKELKIGNTWLAEVSVIPGFYERRQYRPVWTGDAGIKDLMQAIENVKKDGLLPEDYHRRQIQSLSEQIDAQAPPDARLLARRDLLLTDAVILLGYHLQIGKVDPVRLDPNWNLSTKVGTKDPVTLTQEAIDSGSIYRFFSDLKPRDEYYNYLKATLAKYLSIHDDGGWQPVPEGPTLRKGMDHQRVDILRSRLLATGDMVSTPDGPGTRFDADLEEAVKDFQRRRGLKPDGIVGKNTIRALNVPVEVIIDKIRINLERVRWVMNEDLEDFVFVNIPGFEVNYVQKDKIKWSARAQVGKPFRQTPIFRANMTYLEFNPTWTIPPTILSKDVLPAVKKDPGYLQKRNIQVIGKNGKVIDSSTIDWTKYTGRNFPYQLRQKPGPNNALGQVKFMFPNKHLVYLHDTPSKSLFDRESRAFSSGCIRIENPIELARLLLPKGWDQKRIQQIIQSKKTRSVKLGRPVPVILFYLTALPSPDGEFYALEDVYNRDQAVLKELNAAIQPGDQSAN